MSVAVHPLFSFDNSFARDLVGLYEPWQAAPSPSPVLLALNEALAAELGADPDRLRTPDGVAVLVGNAVPDGATPVAQAYAGHQFGGWSPRLGDGRALLLGEVTDVHGRRRDLHLKGSGRTPFARGGDGRAAVGPMLRECLIGEAMHALGIPTTRALAVVATGQDIQRDVMLPGAVLCRVAASHLRVGTFQYAAGTGDLDLLRRLADHAIARHQPAAADAPNPYLALLDGVVHAQASLVAQWMSVGFIHGVMNTDNMTISGETIDYGPCAFIDAYDPATVFSSIDHGGRYAFGNQPNIAQWNLARLAESLLPLINDDADAAVAAATEVLQGFAVSFQRHWYNRMAAKIGLFAADDTANDTLVDDLLASMRSNRSDFTATFRSLSSVVRGAAPPVGFEGWAARWTDALTAQGLEPEETAAAMDAVNPVYIPRNHVVEEALTAATAGDTQPFDELLAIVTAPFDEREGSQRYAQPAPSGGAPYQTFCGT